MKLAGGLDEDEDEGDGDVPSKSRPKKKVRSLYQSLSFIPDRL